MRSLLSTLLGLALIVAMFSVGAATRVVDDAPAAAEPPPVPFALVLTDLPTTEPEVAPSAPATTPTVPDPVLGEARGAWFGCAPHLADTICGPLVIPEPPIEALVPHEPSRAEDWRPLVEAFFAPGDVDRAIRVIRCESAGLPSAKNPRSTASGLFQHLASMWGPRASAAGFGDSDVFDPIANVAVAAWLVYEGGGWSHWYPSRPCWSR